MATTPTGLPTLPEGGGAALPRNSLLDFKDAISKIDQLARENRNAFVPGLASAVPEGTLNASSFGDIVQMLNRGGDKYASETRASALETQKEPDLYYATNDAGVISARNKATGALVWKSEPGAGNVQSGTKDKKSLVNQVLDGFTSFSDLTPTDQTTVRTDLYEMGFGSDVPPIWFKKYIEDELQANLVPEKITEEWVKYRDSITTKSGRDDLDSMIESL